MKLNIGTSKFGIYDIRWSWHFRLSGWRDFYDGPIWGIQIGPLCIEGWGWWWNWIQ